MTTIQRVCSTLLVSALLAACGSADDQPRQEPPPVQDTAFGDLAGTTDKARNVENVTMEHKQELDRTLEQNEGGGDR